nr:f-box/tpr repeat protein pof3 [Quercus suber]
MERFQAQGRDLYNRKNYSKALIFFDRALGRGQSVQLLDNRAACHEKLNNLQAALQDAKKTIQLQKEDPTGYLRAGKVLVEMGKNSVALEIYSHANAPQRLRTVHKSLMDELCPPKSVDPLSVLPRELIEYIFEYLSFKQRMNACLVSKPWTSFIRSSPHLWQHLDLTGARRKVRNIFISRAINTARKRLISATLTNLYDVDKVLVALATHCGLTELTLLDKDFSQNILAESLSRAKSLRVLRLCPRENVVWPLVSHILGSSGTLEVLEYSSEELNVQTILEVHHLTSLALRSVKEYASATSLIREKFPMLRTLKITFLPPCEENIRRGWSLSTLPDMPAASLEHLEVENGGCIDRILTLPSSLHTFVLKLDYQSKDPIMVSDLWGRRTPSESPVRLPLLEKLALDIPGATLDLVKQVLLDNSIDESAIEPEAPLNSISKLQRLSLRNMEIDHFDDLFNSPRVAELRHLEMCLVELNDGHVAVILEKCSKIHTLDLSRSLVTGVAVRQIVREGQIRRLILHDCRKLSIDAVDWARAQGIHVDYRMTEANSGSRKVRH